VTDVDGGAPRHIVDAEVLDTIAWSPDATQLVYAANAGDMSALFLVPAEGGAARRLATPGSATAPTWSAATNVIAYIESHAATQSQPVSTKVAFVTSTGEVPRPSLNGVNDLAYGTRLVTRREIGCGHWLRRWGRRDRCLGMAVALG
jgi:Tol biopolymer transport system component